MTRILAISLWFAASAAAAPKPVHSPLPFIADDYPRALTEARSRQLPIFIEAWAPW